MSLPLLQQCVLVLEWKCNCEKLTVGQHGDVVVNIVGSQQAGCWLQCAGWLGFFCVERACSTRLCGFSMFTLPSSCRPKTCVWARETCVTWASTPLTDTWQPQVARELVVRSAVVTRWKWYMVLVYKQVYSATLQLLWSLVDFVVVCSLQARWQHVCKHSSTTQWVFWNVLVTVVRHKSYSGHEQSHFHFASQFFKFHDHLASSWWVNADCGRLWQSASDQSNPGDVFGTTPYFWLMPPSYCQQPAVTTCQKVIDCTFSPAGIRLPAELLTGLY